jgi:Na+-driven multidrug efflux pump
MAVGVAIMLSGSRGIQIHLADMRPDLGYLRKMLQIGIPASIEGTGRALSVNALLLVVGAFSTPVVAAFGIGTRVFSVIFLPAIAVARGVETMTGQNVGAAKPDRAARANYVAAKGLFAVLFTAGVVIYLFPGPIVDAFTDDPAVLEEGTTFLRYVALSFGFIGIMRAFSGGFRGAGKTLIAAAISILTLGGIRLPLAFGLAETALAQHGIWVAFAISNVAGAVIAWLWFRRGTWRDGGVRGADAASAEAGSVESADTTSGD